MLNRKMTDFTINRMDSKSERDAALTRAERFFENQQLSNAKRSVIDSVLRYAGEKLCGALTFTTAESRFRICSNILNHHQQFDDLHFLQYVISQLSDIGPHENSTLKSWVLPIAVHNRDLLLAREVARTQKAFIGMTAFGMATLFTDYAPRMGFMSILLGVIGYLGSYHLVLGRLQRSLDLQMGRMLESQQEGQELKLEDGLQDEVAIFQQTATGMLGSGMRLFHQTGNAFARIAGQPPQLAVAGARLAEPRVEEMEEDEGKKAAVLRKR